MYVAFCVFIYLVLLFLMEIGVVIKSTGSNYKVQLDNSVLVECKIKGKFRIDELRSTNPVAVGDRVGVELDGNGAGVIAELFDRRNYIVRRSTNLSKQSQIIAANIDRAFLVVTLRSPRTLTSFVDRFLVTAQAYNVPVTLVFNKIDMYSDDELAVVDEWEQIYAPIGYSCIRTSTVDGTNLEALKESMQGKINLLSGNSGVGKSSLMNKLFPHVNQKTAAVSNHHDKGTHTTTFAEMFPLDGGGYVIDTPGIKGFGLLEIAPEELSHYFPEMFDRLKDCQYHNCSHTHEPNCAVVAAVEAGEIALSRYNSYLGMLEDEESENEKYRSGR